MVREGGKRIEISKWEGREREGGKCRIPQPALE